VRHLSRAALAFAALFALVTFTPAVQWWSDWLGGTWDKPQGDILIVLSGDAIDDQTLGVNSYWRVIYAVRAYRQNPYRRVVVTGKVVAPLMRDLLVAQGVPAAIVTMENAATSTRENAIYTARLLAGEPGRKVLVTSDMHMFRSRRAFAKAGLEVAAVPFPYGGKLGSFMLRRWGLFVELLQETSKIAYYRARGWI
jgi:uncharacterized SAM-binding protein YcdF (DUF218 family)